MDLLASGVASMKRPGQRPTVLKGEFATLAVQKIDSLNTNGFALGTDGCNVKMPDEPSLRKVLGISSSFSLQVSVATLRPRLNNDHSRK